MKSVSLNNFFVFFFVTVMAPINATFHQDYNDAPVFYGPDGQVITDEESSFLLSNIPSYPNVNYDDFEYVFF